MNAGANVVGVRRSVERAEEFQAAMGQDEEAPPPQFSMTERQRQVYSIARGLASSRGQKQFIRDACEGGPDPQTVWILLSAQLAELAYDDKRPKNRRKFRDPYRKMELTLKALAELRKTAAMVKPVQPITNVYVGISMTGGAAPDDGPTFESDPVRMG